MLNNIFGKKNSSKETNIGALALSKLQNGEFEDALPLLNKYINRLESLSEPLTKDDAILYYNRAVTKEQLNDLDGAVMDLERCNAIASLHQSFLKLGSLQQKLGRSEESINNIIIAYKLGNDEAENILRKYTNYFH